MKNTILLLVLLIAILTSCKKDKPKESEYLLNATSYLGTEKVHSNIAFLKSSQASVVQSATSLSNYFKTNPENSEMVTTQWSTYLPAGDYIIAIQIANAGIHGMEGTYTYKNITIGKDSPGSGNVMQFDYSNKGGYQAWKEKP